MEYTKELITRNMAVIPEREHYRFRMMQSVRMLRESASSMLSCFGHNIIPDPHELTPIIKVFICPEGIVMPYNRDYILIAFDYEPQRTGMEIVKISDRYNTTHFKEKISKN